MLTSLRLTCLLSVFEFLSLYFIVQRLYSKNFIHNIEKTHFNIKMEVLKNCISNWKVPVVAAFGNPILDMYVVVENSEVLHMFNLDPDGQKEISRQEFVKISDHFKRYVSTVIAAIKL